MGTYCELYIADYPVFSSKSFVEPTVMTLFRESDKKIFRRKISERNPLVWGNLSENDEVETVVEYSIEAKYIKQRLDIMGFNIGRVKRDFDSIKSGEIIELKEYLSIKDTTENDIFNESYAEEIEILEQNSFDDFLSAYQQIIKSKIHPIFYLENNPKSSKLINYILRENEYDKFWGIPYTDVRCFFRMILEIVPEDSMIIQDITDLVEGGYYGENENVCELALQSLDADYPTNSKIIVLTEGSIDTTVLKSSLHLLYPHLSEYYSFMDFGFKVAGSVGHLVNIVKSFAGAGIKNKVVAIFDNDAAGYSGIESLRNIKFPKNIKITQYPDIEVASKYPCNGPTGLIKQNINGLACSIELYFGKDVLGKDGKLTPIQWKAYDSKISRWQGEVMNKSGLQKLFEKKIEKCKDKKMISETDWTGIDSILNHIFNH